MVYDVDDHQKIEAFYANRLGLSTTDRFIGVGSLIPPKACAQHHALYLLQNFNPHMPDFDHCTFYCGSAYAVFKNG